MLSIWHVNWILELGWALEIIWFFILLKRKLQISMTSSRSQQVSSRPDNRISVFTNSQLISDQTVYPSPQMQVSNKALISFFSFYIQNCTSLGWHIARLPIHSGQGEKWMLWSSQGGDRWRGLPDPTDPWSLCVYGENALLCWKHTIHLAFAFSSTGRATRQGSHKEGDRK